MTPKVNCFGCHNRVRRLTQMGVCPYVLEPFTPGVQGFEFS